MSNTKTKIVISALLLSILVGCTQSPTSTFTSPLAPPRPTYTIGAGIIAKGILVPKHIIQLAFNISGRVRSTYVEIGNEVHTGDALIQLETVLLEADVVRAEGALQAAQAEFEYRKSLLDPPELQTVADSRISIAEADLVKARYMLTQATLTAPFDGTIVDVQILPGETVNPGRAIITLADLRIFQVETLDLDEVDVPRIYVGQPVDIHIESLDIKVDGIVVTIAPQATILGEKRVYKVIIKLNSQPNGIRWGMSAEANFVINE